jgi:hypothetical protein
MPCPHWAIVTVEGGMVRGIDTSPEYPGSIYILDLDPLPPPESPPELHAPTFAEHPDRTLVEVAVAITETYRST